MAERIRYQEIEARREFGLALICNLGDLAVLMSRRPDIGLQIKPDGSKVTDIDTELNDQIIERFGESFPDDLVWGEEGANSPIERVLSDQFWAWRGDSIDSTSSLVKAHAKVMSGGLADFSNCRATILLSGFAPGDQSPSISLIHSPFLPNRPTLQATPDGAWVIDAMGTAQLRLAGDGPQSLPEVERFDCVSWREARPNFRELLEAKLPEKRVERRLSMGAVALRAVDFSVFPGPLAQPYDVAAGAHIGQMAGATVRTLGGRRFEEVNWLHGPIDGVVVAASEGLAEEVIREHDLLQAA